MWFSASILHVFFRVRVWDTSAHRVDVPSVPERGIDVAVGGTVNVFAMRRPSPDPHADQQRLEETNKKPFISIPPRYPRLMVYFLRSLDISLGKLSYSESFV